MLQLLRRVFFIGLLFGATTVLAKEADAQPTSLKAEIKAYINHHLEDAHDFTLLSYTAKDGHKVFVFFGLQSKESFVLKFNTTTGNEVHALAKVFSQRLELGNLYLVA